MPNAIVTGATQGIGKAIAELLLSNGFSVAICARTQTDLDKLKEEWSQTHPESTIITCRADLSDKTQVENFAKHVTSELGQVDILVNNAGLFYPGEVLTEPDGRLEMLMSVNLYSAYYLTRAIEPNISRGGSGHIFNISSVAGLRAYPNGGAYSISKYALAGFSENLREELRPKNIKVTTVYPGATYSRSWAGVDVEENRLMQANDVANMIWATYNLSPSANTETIIMRPVKGDL